MVALGLGALAMLAGEPLGAGAGLVRLCRGVRLRLIWWTAERVAAPRIERAQAVDVTGVVESVQPLAAERLTRIVVAPEGEGQPARVRVNIDEVLAPAGLAPGRAGAVPGVPDAAGAAGRAGRL